MALPSVKEVLRDAKEVLRDIRYHAPSIRLPDSLVGAGVGALGGLATAGIRDRAGGAEDEKDKPNYLAHALGGAGIGFGVGNLIGDRARRYISNNVPMSLLDNSGEYRNPHLSEYVGSKTGIPITPGQTTVSYKDFLRYGDWGNFYRTAIYDRPSRRTSAFIRRLGGSNIGNRISRELLRRHMNLPAMPGTLLQALGKRRYTPGPRAGGIGGNRNHFRLTDEFNNEEFASNDLLGLFNHYNKPGGRLKSTAHEQGPLSAVLGRHDYEYDKANATAQVTSQLDFRRAPGNKQFSKWPWLNRLLGSGRPVFTQRFDMPEGRIPVPLFEK